MRINLVQAKPNFDVRVKAIDQGQPYVVNRLELGLKVTLLKKPRRFIKVSSFYGDAPNILGLLCINIKSKLSFCSRIFYSHPKPTRGTGKRTT